MQGYVQVQGALRKKELIASFVKHFTENHQNTICIVFRFDNANLSQERCFILHLLHETMYRIQGTRAATNYFFRRVF